MIRLSRNDIEFMIFNLDLSDDLRMLLEKLRDAQDKTITDDLADQLRDLCTQKLDTHGFDINYDPTELGIKLEELIDKLYIG